MEMFPCEFRSDSAILPAGASYAEGENPMTIRSHRPRLRLAAVVLTVAATFAAGLAVAARTGTAEAALVSTVEDEGADCPVPALPDAGSLPTNAKLPDPFKRLDGTRIATKSDWRCRREEVKKLAEKFVYGEKPGKPQSVTGTVSGSTITVNVTHNGKSASFSAGVSCPAGPGRSPPSSCSAGSARTPPRSGPPVPRSSTTTPTRSARRALPATTSRARSTASTARRARPGCSWPGPGASAGSSTSSPSPAATSCGPTGSVSRAAPGSARARSSSARSTSASR